MYVPRGISVRDALRMWLAPASAARAEHSPVTTYSLSLKMVGPVPPIQMVGPPPCTGPKLGLVWLKRAAPHHRFTRQLTAENAARTRFTPHQNS